MAQLKDLIVTGPSRFLNDLYALTMYEGGVKLEDKYYLATNPSGYTSNAGTVTSVQVQATAPIASSTATAQSTSLSTTISLNYDTNTLSLISGTPSKLSVKVPVPFNGDSDGDVLRWNGTTETPYWGAPPWSITDTQVSMTADSTTSSGLPVLLGPSSITSGNTYGAKYATANNKDLKFTPSTGNLSGVAKLNGHTIGELAFISGEDGVDDGGYLQFTGANTYAWATPLDTTYSFASGTGLTNGFTVTPLGGSATTYTVGSLIANQDTRSTNTAPSTYYASPNGALRFMGLKNNSTIGISTSVGGTYSGVLGLSPWSDSSGGHAWEFALNQNGVYARHGTSSWSSWEQISFSDAKVKLNAKTDSSNYRVLLGPSSPTDGSTSEAYYANTQNKQLSFNPSNGDLRGIGLINGDPLGSLFSVSPNGDGGYLLYDPDDPDYQYQWVSPSWMLNPMTAKGDLIVGGISGNAGKFGVGSNGQVLMADSNQTRGIKWTTPIWRTIKVNGNNALDSTIDSNNYINFTGSGSVSVSWSSSTKTISIYGSQTCLIEGTKILMADGTEKNIEDIERGDLIMSYDPNTRHTCEAVVLACDNTGTSDDFVNYFFDNGSMLTIFGKHCIYNKEIGTAKDCSKWVIGNTGIDYHGEEVMFVGTEDLNYAGRKCHYDLRSSNMLYFANGILNAESLTWNYSRHKDDDLPESFKMAMKADFDSSANLHKHQFTRSYGTELAPVIKEIRRQEKIIADNKELLADSDYIVQKFTEGLIGTVEWLKTKSDRVGWRSLINKAEEALTTAKNRMEAVKTKYKASETRRERYNAAVARDNACLDELKAFYAAQRHK